MILFMSLYVVLFTISKFIKQLNVGSLNNLKPIENLKLMGKIILRSHNVQYGTYSWS